MTAALLLARASVPTVVLEAEPNRTPIGSKSICVQRDVLDILQRAGVGDAVADAGVTWYRGRTFYREHEVLDLTFPEVPGSAWPPFVNTPQSVVEMLLEQRIAGEPLVDLRYDHRVTGVEQDDDGVTAIVDGRKPLRGTHCVVADGSRSTVRRALGLSFEGHSFPDKFLIADVRVDLGLERPERRFYFDPPWNPGRQVLVHPQPDGVVRIDWQVPEEFDLDAEHASGVLDARIRKVAGDAEYEIVWMSSYTFHQRCVPTMRVGRVLLAGDAAHLMSPFGARGLNSGIADAENAAWKIALDRDGLAGPGLLESYDIERRAAAAENLRITGTTMRFLVPSTEEDRGRRLEVLERSVHDESARPLIDSGKLSEPFWYVDSPLTTRPSTVDYSAFPREPGVPRPAVPGVLCPDVRLDWGMRLREYVGPKFVLLTHQCPLDSAPSELLAQPVPLEHADWDGPLRTVLDLQPETAALVRPDGYLTAVLAGDDLRDELDTALRRATGWCDR
ncbi:pentachlorophenol monooxygenase/3-(3-hydroxy-phenyl)propionate hydroxylase [Herbihabitans rhizosphaerae]|uniref:Pentachlorophenol monooxygenase/3-(3-hydroxy-phenyl)propionate hydroxylase n=2 Tax=Herbihabitans rhizosphaerae TaxID=1872711 RepID=A0A4Q7KKG2_9PSEU|nr:pentachlorophenol monooxygenase/3-(3-hydroxy-phenyl)propionate hydroxylase [Herbihabitans rhizosphaerae]